MNLLRGLSLALIVLLAGCAPALPARPNFVILIADDLGWNDLGAYGSLDGYTPRIDQLARRTCSSTRPS